MQRVLFFLFSLLLTFFFSQKVNARLRGQPLIDSLKTELDKTKEDTLKIHLLDLISFAYRIIDPDQGIAYANKQLELSKAMNLKDNIGFAYNNLGSNNYSKSNYPTALEYHFKALKYLKKQATKMA